MRVLLTGSAGFIGFHLVKKLLALGHEVFSVDCINHYYDPRLKYARLAALGLTQAQVESGQWVTSTSAQHHFLKCNIHDRLAMQALFQQQSFDAIVHLAAQAGVRYSIENPLAYIDDNISGFANILEGARQQQVQHLVYASSSSVYGLNTTVPYQTHHSAEHPVSLYAATKKSNEMMAHAYSHLYQIPTTGLRFFTVYGPWGRPDMAPMLFLQAIMQQQPIKVFNHGHMQRDFTYIDTVVEGCARVLAQPPKANVNWPANQPTAEQSSAPFAIHNIGGESTVKLATFIQTLEQTLGRTAEKIFMDAPPGDVLSTHADMQAFNKAFGPLPSTPLAQGLAALYDWYQTCGLYTEKV